MIFRRILFLSALTVFGMMGLALPGPVEAQAARKQPAFTASAPLTDAVRRASGGKIRKFYRSRDYRPLWIENGLIGSNAQRLLKFLDEAELDGEQPSRYRPDDLREYIAAADSGNVEALAAAEVRLTKAFVRYVDDTRQPSDTGMEFADRGLKPQNMADDAILRVATMHDFGGYLANMGWMSPHYVRMRKLLQTALNKGQNGQLVDTIRRNLERARILPSASVRHIVVDIATAQLWYYQAGEQVGNMRVVVGTDKTRTPMLAGYLNYAVVNPYWNIPDYLTRENVARKILAGKTLKSLNMEVLSDWSANPEVLDPATIDWHAVESGAVDVRIRELPGPLNSMGKVKFIFPNDHGIYLHDTPNRDLFAKTDRHLSNGCIRLERAAELGKWLMGKPVTTKSKEPEQAIPLPVPVPVYLTYLTPVSTKKGVAIAQDAYGFDS